MREHWIDGVSASCGDLCEGFGIDMEHIKDWASPGDSAVKNLPAMQEPQETGIWSLAQEDPLEEGMATHSSFLVWRISWTEEPGRLQAMGSQRVGHDWNDLVCTCIKDLWEVLKQEKECV